MAPTDTPNLPQGFELHEKIIVIKVRPTAKVRFENKCGLYILLDSFLSGRTRCKMACVVQYIVCVCLGSNMTYFETFVVKSDILSTIVYHTWAV